MRLSLEQAVANARSAGDARRYPVPGDPRLRAGAIFSALTPRFSFAHGATIFTLGSCFARTVEEKLVGFTLPTTRIAVPTSERPGRPNGILNEYNPGTICQRVEHAARGASFEDRCIAPEGDGYLDLLLPEYVTPATKERLLARRAQVDQVYAALSGSDAVIVTLDLVEAWYDRAAGLYLNRLPPPGALMWERARFELHIFDVDDTRLLLERLVKALVSIGVRKIVLSVSPVPMEATYAGVDCAVANAFSKAVLVASAHAIRQQHAEVDYFPGYEIVSSVGRDAYEADQVHIRDDVVALVTDYLVEKYAA
jgi:hypothetical protein